ncbi:LRR receptor-like serine/threonine-protein kinase [Bienertia sinuspersici]
MLDLSINFFNRKHSNKFRESSRFPNNNLSGELSQKYWKLEELESFHAYQNTPQGSIPECLGNSEKLGGIIPSEVGSLKSLNFIDFSDNHFVGRIPSFVSCSSLEYLDVHSNKITSFVPDELPKSLQFLDVSNNQVKGILPSSIGSLINLGNNDFFGEIPKEVGQISTLEISLT